MTFFMCCRVPGYLFYLYIFCIFCVDLEKNFVAKRCCATCLPSPFFSLRYFSLSYLVLARKSRPQCFAEVVGQKPVVRTLQNALCQGRVPHALIFSGVRGTGKTTLARIMAKALNCAQGPTEEPCLQCTSCREITEGISVDLQEVDGASNRGIQEIRELKEKICFMPANARHKIIIIDEVHMLTTEAFNALLKTLEEPPAHVYFMFATTEPHKVPLTILSRCQRYELKQLSHSDLSEHFQRLADQEGVRMEPEALNMVVREARGSVRDGLSLLDQIFSYCGEKVKTTEVVDILGLVSHQMISSLAASLLAGDLATVFRQLDEMYQHAADIRRFGNDLLQWFRNLLVCKLGNTELAGLSDKEIGQLKSTAALHSLDSLSNMFRLLLESLDKVALSQHPRLAMEMAFIRAVQARDVVPLADLVARFDQVLQNVDPMALSLPPQTIQQAQQRTPEPAPAASSDQVAVVPPENPVPIVEVAPHTPPETTEPPPKTAKAPKSSVASAPQPSAPPSASPPEWLENDEEQREERVEQAVVLDNAQHGARKSPKKQREPKKSTFSPAPSPVQTESAEATTEQSLPTVEKKKAAAPEQQAEAVNNADLGKQIRKRWPEFLNYVKEHRRPWIAESLRKASAPELQGDELLIRFDDKADCSLLKRHQEQDEVTEFLLDFYQCNLRLHCIAPNPEDCASDANSGLAPQQERRALANEALVLAAAEIFNGHVGDIRIGPAYRRRGKEISEPKKEQISPLPESDD